MIHRRPRRHRAERFQMICRVRIPARCSGCWLAR
jgi:hypothetical protein